MPAKYCKNCIWGMSSKDFDKRGIECTNPKLENIQSHNLMPANARACPLYEPVKEKR